MADIIPRLRVVLDLDETLIHANRLHRPKRKMGQIISKKRKLSLILPLEWV